MPVLAVGLGHVSVCVGVRGSARVGVRVRVRVGVRIGVRVRGWC